MKNQKGRFERKEDGAIQFVPDENGQWKILSMDGYSKSTGYFAAGIDPVSGDGAKAAVCITTGGKSDFIRQLFLHLKYFNASNIVEEGHFSLTDGGHNEAVEWLESIGMTDTAAKEVDLTKRWPVILYANKLYKSLEDGYTDYCNLEPWEYYNKYWQVDGKPVKPVTKEEWEYMTNPGMFHNIHRRRR